MLAALALLLGSSEPIPLSPATLPGHVVDVVARDFFLQAPDTIPAGLTTLRLRVMQGEHIAVLVRLDSGHTALDLLRARRQGHPRPAWMHPRWRSRFPSAGRNGERDHDARPRTLRPDLRRRGRRRCPALREGCSIRWSCAKGPAGLTLRRPFSLPAWSGRCVARFSFSSPFPGRRAGAACVPPLGNVVRVKGFLCVAHSPRGDVGLGSLARKLLDRPGRGQPFAGAFGSGRGGAANARVTEGGLVVRGVSAAARRGVFKIL